MTWVAFTEINLFICARMCDYDSATERVTPINAFLEISYVPVYVFKQNIDSMS